MPKGNEHDRDWPGHLSKCQLPAKWMLKDREGWLASEMLARC